MSDKVKASAIYAEAFRLEGEVARLTRERDEARARQSGWLATITQMREEVAGLRALLGTCQQCAERKAAMDAAESERDALRAEVQRLRDVLKALLAFPGSNAADHEKCDEECPYEQARAALCTGGDRG